MEFDGGKINVDAVEDNMRGVRAQSQQGGEIHSLIHQLHEVLIDVDKASSELIEAVGPISRESSPKPEQGDDESPQLKPRAATAIGTQLLMLADYAKQIRTNIQDATDRLEL